LLRGRCQRAEDSSVRSEEDGRQEVHHLIETLGKGGGYILGPSHVIQTGTPAENILAMFDEALQYYPF